jgi:hypothetical protein
VAATALSLVVTIETDPSPLLPTYTLPVCGFTAMAVGWLPTGIVAATAYEGAGGAAAADAAPDPMAAVVRRISPAAAALHLSLPLRNMEPLRE